MSFSIYENIFIAATLLIGSQLYAATTKVDFVDVNNREPSEQSYDQQCQLTGTTIVEDGDPPAINSLGLIPNNAITLYVGDNFLISILDKNRIV